MCIGWKLKMMRPAQRTLAGRHQICSSPLCPGLKLTLRDFQAGCPRQLRTPQARAETRGSCGQATYHELTTAHISSSALLLNQAACSRWECPGRVPPPEHQDAHAGKCCRASPAASSPRRCIRARRDPVNTASTPIKMAQQAMAAAGMSISIGELALQRGGIKRWPCCPVMLQIETYSCAPTPYPPNACKRSAGRLSSCPLLALICHMACKRLKGRLSHTATASCPHCDYHGLGRLDLVVYFPTPTPSPPDHLRVPHASCGNHTCP